MSRIWNGENQKMVTRTVTSGRLGGTNNNDTLTGIAQNGLPQIHVYAMAGDDLINLDFSSNINKFSHGHHARGDGDGANSRGADTFNFRNTHNVSNGEVVVGRLEDFDGRDRILLEGNEIDLGNLPNNVRVVEFNGAHNDPGATPQQWLLITTSTGGHIFYALEGARADMNGNGGANEGVQEKHFIHSADLPNFAALPDVDYVDTQNYVPAGYSAQGGTTINDYDATAADVQAQVIGTGSGDLIAAGLNDDTVRAGGGNDRVWGGSGDDTINAGSGNDTVWGGTGDDNITGATGNDKIYGEDGDDVLNGWGGDDRQYGGDGDDRVYGQQGDDRLDGGRGDDRLYGSTGDDLLLGRAGSDLLNGGAGTDRMAGGGGADTFEFNDGDLMDWDNLGGSWAARNAQLDLITDFRVGSDVIAFDGVDHVDDMSDLRSWLTTIDGDRHFTVQVRATNERVLVDVDETVSWGDFFDSDNFNIV